MSKTKNKRDARKKEQNEFLLARRMQQLSFIKQALEIGEKIFNDNKDKLSEDEIAQIEKMRQEQADTVAKVEAEIQALLDTLDEVNKNPQA